MTKVRFAARGSRFTICLAVAVFSIWRTCVAVTFTEDFSSDPLQNGWAIFGDTNLFQWDSTNQILDVTWDSSQSNSYFYHPLGTTLGKADAFTVDFDITLDDLQYSNSFQFAVGLLNITNAMDPGFSRPLVTAPNLFEFDYFPDDGLGEPNIAATLVDATATNLNFIYDVLPMNLGTTYHISLAHGAGDTNITGTVLTGGEIYTTMPNSFSGVIGDFALDSVAIMNYSGAGQSSSFFGYILAHGTVDNFRVTLPPPVRAFSGAFSSGVWQTQFNTYGGWLYTLQRSTNMASWNDASASIAGNGGILMVTDTNAPADRAFYRVHAQQETP